MKVEVEVEAEAEAEAEVRAEVKVKMKEWSVSTVRADVLAGLSEGEKRD